MIRKNTTYRELLDEPIEMPRSDRSIQTKQLPDLGVLFGSRLSLTDIRSVEVLIFRFKCLEANSPASIRGGTNTCCILPENGDGFFVSDGF